MLDSRSGVHPADALRASFAAIAESVPFTEVIKLVNVLPRELKALWPAYMFGKLDADSIARST
jgi:uncharacterized protein (DUF2267 family)